MAASSLALRDGCGWAAMEQAAIAIRVVLMSLDSGIDGDYTRYVVRACFLALFAVSAASAQYEVPRKANEYPAHAMWPQFEVGAEYLIHSVPAEKGAIYARDYLVIEVAVYPVKAPVTVLSAHFVLRVNDRKTVLYPESPGFVAAYVKYPNWSQDREVVGTAQVGDGTVMIGPRSPSRFPGDPTVGSPPRPEADPNAEPRAPVNVEDMIARAALPEGETRVPWKGCLYFAYDGKLKSIHKLELDYDDGHEHKGSLVVFQK